MLLDTDEAETQTDRILNSPSIRVSTEVIK